MNDDQPVKKRGRPKGSKTTTGYVPAGRPKGTTKPKMGDILEESGGVNLVPPSKRIKKPPQTLDLAKAVAPTELMPVPGNTDAVPKMITTILAIRNTVDLDNPMTLWNAMELYLNLCSNTGMKISNSTLYTACGIDRRTIHDWEYGLRRQNNPEYRKFAQMAKMVCAAAREQYGIEGQVNPILTIFHQKFYDGLKDNPPDEAAENPLGEITDPEKLAEKYADIILD